jgi:hypothetical protein
LPSQKPGPAGRLQATYYLLQKKPVWLPAFW